MSYYPPSENGTKVNMIKQKFEQNLLGKEGALPQSRKESSEQKESLRRSLSVSPVKSKKNIKLNFSRQLSNPGGKNIKRTPAFRGDKTFRMKNLQSPTKERLVSIVDKNVKIFEETPEYGKIGNVKKKDTVDEDKRLDCGGSNNADNFKCLGSSGERRTKNTADPMDRVGSRRVESWRDSKPVSKTPRSIDNSSVRTTVISRQKNISPIFPRDEETSNWTPKENPANSMSNQEESRLEKFLKNGVEYTKVRKPNRQLGNSESSSVRLSCGKENANRFINDSGVLDVREELSRRIHPATDADNEEDSSDTVDGGTMERVIASRKSSRYAEESSGRRAATGTTNLDKMEGVELTETLKAALQAPLPAGPPPKKPPRTFLHSPLRSLASLNENKLAKSSPTKPLGLENNSKQTLNSNNSADSKKTESLRAKDSSRDSKKMLEKLELVLIQHQKALGAKVIMPRKEKQLDTSNLSSEERLRMSRSPTSDTENSESTENTEKRSYFHNRLSRTLEDSKKLGSSPKAPVESKTRKHSTFDCLPSLNCSAWTSEYEQVRNPDFKSYFTETECLRESKNSISKSQDSLESSASNLPSCNSEFSDEPAASKRLSSELTTFQEGKKRQLNTSAQSEERVYAEPFTFDKNSGTDITSYGIFSSDEHNYFSRSLQEERFGKPAENFIFSEKRNSTSPRVNRCEEISLTKPALHYMCTSLQPLVYEDNNNEPDEDCAISKSRGASDASRKNLSRAADDCRSARAELDKFNKIKVEQLLNQAFGKFAMAGSETATDSNASSDTDSLASSPSVGEHLPSFNEKLRLFKSRENGEKPSRDELHRSLTETRKNYVRRVSSKYSERREGESIIHKRNELFQVCLLVELNLSTREPYIKDKYPAYAKTPAWIENFCFPDAMDWPKSESNQNQFYSLVLMDERGNRRYGYCCRVRPEDGPILPLAYCLITKYRASGFYQKVLLELESRHGLPERKRRKFIEELYNSSMPKPGQSLRMAVDENEQASSCSSATEDDRTKSKKVILSKFIDPSDKECSGHRQKPANLSSALLSNERTFSERMMDILTDSGSPESVIIRSGDPRLEERDMSQLFDAVSNKVLIVLFGSLLLERKVVLLCDKLSKLSSCVDALQSLLYPFSWPHTFIPVLPDIPGLSEILQAPLPFVIGILKSKHSSNTDISVVRDGIVVDLDTSKVVYAVGDESSILPTRLQKGIRSALQLVHSHTKSGDGIRNFLVSEAFLRVLVETCSHCDSHLVTQQDGKVIFQKESFIKASSSSKTVQYFLEWFVETTMFNTFIEDCIARMEGRTSPESVDVKLFYQRAAEFRKRTEKSATSKNGCVKKKTLGDRLKDLTNFHT